MRSEALHKQLLRLPDAKCRGAHWYDSCCWQGDVQYGCQKRLPAGFDPTIVGAITVLRLADGDIRFQAAAKLISMAEMP
jgi:hypothetical protein